MFCQSANQQKLYAQSCCSSNGGYLLPLIAYEYGKCSRHVVDDIDAAASSWARDFGKFKFN